MDKHQFRLAGGLRASIRIALCTAAMASGPLFAQAITGGVYGRLPAGGNVEAEVVNPATGYDSKVRADNGGRYAVSGLMPGDYIVKLLRDGQVVDQQSVTVRAGSNSAAMFGAEAAQGAGATAGKNATELGVVKVTAAQPSVNAIDVSTSQQVQTWSSTDVNRLPLVNPDLLNVGAMQANVASITSSHGVAPQFNGSSGTENRYFINEYNVTDMQQGSVPDKIPNEAFASISTVDGGMDAKYGSALGGVISGTIKQGTNDFKGGVDLTYTPPTGTFNENGKNTYNYDGSLVQANQLSHWSPSLLQDYWISGPLIKDKLFFYVLAENQPNNYGQGTQGLNPTVSYSNGNYKTLNTNRNNQFLVNLTWNIADGHTLNVFYDKQDNSGGSSQYALATPYDPGSASSVMNNMSGWAWRDQMAVANYHGQITDTFAVSAMVGTSQQYFFSYPQFGIDVPYVEVDNPENPNDKKILSNGATSNYFLKYRSNGARLDFTWTPFDGNEVTFGGERFIPSMAQANIPNPNNWYYSACSTALGTDQPCTVAGQAVAPGTKYAKLVYDPRVYYNRSPTRGFYLADSWHIADNWTVYAGVRRDNYAMTDNANIQMYSKSDTTPRVGVAWDVHGDSSLKIGATAGEYSEGIPLYFNAYGGSPGEGYIHTATYYTYTGMDANGVPTGLTQIGTPQGSAGSGLHSLTADQFISRTTQNAKAKQFELYAQQQLGSWTAGASLFTSKLTGLPNIYNNTAQMQAYLTSQGYPNASLLGNYLITPGKDIVVPVQLNGVNSPLTLFTFPNSFMQTKSLSRRIYQFSLTMDHAYSDMEPYYLSASYTWRHEFGNTDGLTSYAGGGNNTGATGYDGGLSSAGFQQGSAGNLGDDIPATVKVFGYYKFVHQDNFLKGLRLGGALTFYKGGPVDCLSTYPHPADGGLVSESQAGNSNAYYCNTLQNALKGQPVSDSIVYPRGSYGRLPSYKQVDLDVGYDWSIDKNAFSVDLKVQNLFNNQSVTQYVTQLTNGNKQFNTNFMQPNAFQQGRVGQLVFRWQFN